MSPETQVTQDVPVRLRTPAGQTRVLAALFVGTIGWTSPFGAATMVLLPARVAELSSHDKVGRLAVLTTAAAVVGLVTNVVFGTLSDRTRSRWGRRTPWIVAGALASGLALLATPHAGSLPGLILAWCAVVVGLNATNAALAALVPDRVPPERRARASAAIGLGLLVGTAAGTVTAAGLVGHQGIAYAVLAGLGAGLPVAAVLIAPEPEPRPVRPGSTAARPGSTAARPGSPPDRPRDPSRRSFLRSLAPPRHAPDFYWALWGRLMLVLGYFMIQNLQLYILTDYVHLSRARAAPALAVNAVVFLVTAIAGTLVAGPLSDRWHRRKPFVLLASGLAACAAAVPLLSATTAAVTGFAIVGGLAFGAYYSVDTALMTEVLPSDTSRARDLGILNIANTGGQVVAPAAGAGLVGLGAGFGPLFVAAIICCGIGAVLILPIRKVR